MLKKLLPIILLFVPAGPALGQSAPTLLQESMRAQLGRAAFPLDLIVAGEIADDRGAVKPFRMLVKGKDKVRYENTGRVTIYNAGLAWVERAGKVEALPAHVAVHRPEIFPFLDLVAEADNPLLEVIDQGFRSLGGQNSRRIDLRMRDRAAATREFRRALDEETQFYFDPSTLLIVRSERTIPVANNMDARIPSASDFSDYRKVQEFAIPFRIVNTVGSASMPLRRSTITITSVLFNQGIPDSSFLPSTTGGGR